MELLPILSRRLSPRHPTAARPLTLLHLRPEIEPYEDRRHMEPDFGGLAQVALVGTGAALLGNALSQAAVAVAVPVRILVALVAEFKV